jgi:hypothetical protein
MAPKLDDTSTKPLPMTPEKSRVKILLVDDSAENLVSLEAALEILDAVSIHI